jgi:hypothetical protein
MVRSWLKKLLSSSKKVSFKCGKRREIESVRDELGKNETNDPSARDDGKPRSLSLPAAGGEHGRVAEEGDVGVLGSDVDGDDACRVERQDGRGAEEEKRLRRAGALVRLRKEAE